MRSLTKESNLEDVDGEILVFWISSRHERIKLRELIPHIGPLPIVIPQKLFLERIGCPADNVSSRVAWKLRGGVKVQKRVGSAGVAKNAKQERIKRVYPLLIRNENRF